ncbi:hypothetical protein IWW57_000947 [Coemansia sp. S610]|nr:hypothetical protein IWW57_000947 [Coemansia sp. S610]
MPVAKRLISKRLAQSLAEFMVQGDRMLSKYGSSAESMVVGGSRRAFSVAVGAAKQGATKSKEQLGKLKGKSKDAKEQVKDAKEEVKDAAKAVADKAHDLADTENKLAQQQEYRRDSLVERI